MTNPNIDRAPAPKKKAAKKTKKRVMQVTSTTAIESHDQHEDWSLEKAKALGFSARKKKIPASKDLRESWWNVGNQGDTGSCVGWALADSVLRYHFVKSRKLREDEHISVRYIWMAAKEMDHKCHYPTTFLDDAGTSAKSALRVVKKIGALKTSVLPFDGGLVKLKEAPLPQRCRSFEGEGLLQLCAAPSQASWGDSRNGSPPTGRF